MSTDTNSPAGNGRHRSARHAAPAAAGRVRWKRFAIMFIPAAGVSAALLVATANGALAASFSISGQQGETSADSLTGQGFEQFGTADVANSLNGNALQPVVESEISSAQITNLCQSLVETLPLGLGTFTLKITGGDNGTPASASSLIIDANQLSGSTATFNNIQQGIDNSQLKPPTPALAGHGNYAQQATSVTITNLQEIAYSTEAGTFTLPGFSLNLTAGDNPCFASPNEPVNTFHL
ncbi:MAG: cholesterol esterase [Actinobacteria bacterium]|nr:cholesterol esterase [Actinomycetota bacterium]